MQRKYLIEGNNTYLQTFINKRIHKPHMFLNFCKMLEGHEWATKVVKPGCPKDPDWCVEFLDINIKATSIVPGDKSPQVKFSRIEGEE